MALIVVAVLLVVAIKAAERFIDVDRYRPALVQKINESTGLHPEIARLQLSLLPLPSVYAYDVTLAKEASRIHSSEVAASLRLRSLFRKSVDVSEIDAYGVTLVLPENLGDLKRYYQDIRQAKKPAGEKRWSYSIEQVNLRGVRVFMGQNKTPLAIGDIEIRDVLSSEAPIELNAKLPLLGEDARLTADVSIIRAPGATPTVEPKGTVTLTGCDPRSLLKNDLIPPVSTGVTATIVGYKAGELHLTIEGAARAANNAPDEVRAAAGDFTAHAWWKDGAIIVNDLAWNAPALSLTADLTRAVDGSLACEVRQAKVGEDLLRHFASLMKPKEVRLSVVDGATAEVAGLLIGTDGGKRMRMVTGDVAIRGVEPVFRGEAKPFGALEARAHMEEGILVVDQMSGKGLSVTGRITPDLAEPSLAIDLQGDVDLSLALLAAFGAPKSITGIEGAARLDRIAATFRKGHKGTPEDLVMDGVIKNGAMSLMLGAFQERVGEISGDFHIFPDRLDAKLKGNSGLLGPLDLDGRLGLTDRVVTATIGADLAKLSLPFLLSESAKDRIEQLSSVYGTSSFTVNAQLPTAASPSSQLSVSRAGSPPLECAVSFAKSEDRWLTGPIQASTTLAADSLAGLLPKSVTASGPLAVQMDWASTSAPLAVKIDLSETILQVGALFSKRVSDPCTVSFAASPGETGWTPWTATLAYGGETLDAVISGGQVSGDVDLDLAALQGLLPSGTRAGGRLAGKFCAPPLTCDLELSDCAFALSEALVVDSASGRVKCVDGVWTTTPLRLRGLNSDFELNADVKAGLWTGSLTGQALDIDALTSAWNNARAVFAPDKPEEPPSPKREPTRADFAINMREVIYRGTPLTNARCRVTSEGNVTRLDDISCTPGSGLVKGGVGITKGTDGGPSSVRMNLAFDKADVETLDRLIFKEPRELKGAIDGTLDVTAPFGKDILPLNGATGTAEFTAHKGTLGKMRMVTQILAFIRTTEVLRLRMPSLKDEGLTFDKCSGKLSIDQGVLKVEEFFLENPSLAVMAAGTVDYPREDTQLGVAVHLLETLTGLIGVVPGLGTAADEIRKYGSLRFSLTGPPSKLKVDFLTAPTELGTEPVRDVLKGTVGEVLKIIRKK